MKKLILFAAALCWGSLASAQASWPTASPDVARGEVPLQCNAGVTACTPILTANPMPVSVVSGSTGASANQVQGNIANGTTDSGNPVKMGCKANSAAPSAVTAGQRVDQWCSIEGIQVVTLGARGALADGMSSTQVFDAHATDGISANLPVVLYGFDGTAQALVRADKNGLVVQPALSATFWNYAAASGGIVSSTADVAVKAAAGASVRNYVCTIDVTHALLSATTEIVAKDGATVIWRSVLQTPATDVGAGAGKISFSPCLRGTANTAVNVALITSVTGGVYFNLSGYTGS